MAKHTYGLAAIKIGTIPGDGGVATTFVEVGETVQGTASMTADDNTITEFKIEESDSPVESTVTQVGAIKLTWSTYNTDSNTLSKFLGGTATPGLGANRIATFGSVTAGTGYTNGTYTDVPLITYTGSGTGARATLVIAGGGVSTVTLTDGGTGFAVADVLRVAATDVGGTATTPFSVPVATVTASAVAEKYEAPDSFPDVEKSIQVTDKKGTVITFPRAKIATKPSLSFSRDKLGQLDMTATVLQPTKAGTKRMTIVYA